LTRAFPHGKRFAFTVLDDTDVATVENVGPVYRLFESLGLRTTKTIWSMPCPEGSADFSDSETLDDPEYRDFVVDLQRRGFEIASHGATMESSTRARTVAGLERFRETFGSYPRVHVNHSHNRENVYWGTARLDDPVLVRLYRRLNGQPAQYYQGHQEESPYWWGDLCREHVMYVRNLTFEATNIARINPSMPYHDPSRPLVRWWFSGAEAEGARQFVDVLRADRLDRLEREGGICIVSTHLGKSFANDGLVHPLVRARLEDVARRPGWFPTVSQLLDWLREQRSASELPALEWRRMQWRWARDLVRRKVARRLSGLSGGKAKVDLT
jgi:hypothetical protein